VSVCDRTRKVGETVSTYQLNRAVYDWVRAGEVNSSAGGDGRAGFDVSRYALSDDERKAFDSKDIGAMFTLGLHQVLVNRYARAIGLTLKDYRGILEPLGTPQERRGRWQS
jgi:hypothetical protein